MVDTFSRRFSLDFQNKILAVAARTPYFLKLYSDSFNPALFETQYHKDLCVWLAEYNVQYNASPNRSTLLHILGKKIKKSNPLYDGYKILVDRIYRIDLSDSDYLTDQVKYASRFQSVRSALSRMTDMLDKGEFDSMEKALHDSLRTGTGIGDLGLDLITDMESAVLKFGVLETPVSTGFTDLENKIGKFYPTEETVIVAPPGAGKTTMLGNLAYGASRRDQTVLYYTLEIGAERLLCRFYSNMAKIEAKDLSGRLASVRAAVKRFRMSTNGTVYVKFFPAKMATVDTLRNHLSMAKGYDINPSLVVVDYADLLRCSSSMTRSPRHEQLREIYEDLRALASEYNVHMMTASQSRRQTLYADIIDLDDLSESWGKAATADSIVAMCMGREEQEAKVLRLYIAKARNDTRATFVDCSTDFAHLNIKEVTRDRYRRILRRAGFAVDEDGRLIGRGRGRGRGGVSRETNNELEEHYGRRSR